MLGCDSCAAANASRVNRATNTGSLAHRLLITVRATGRSSDSWRARYTVPIPPRPISCSMAYPRTSIRGPKVTTASGSSWSSNSGPGEWFGALSGATWPLVNSNTDWTDGAGGSGLFATG